MIMLFMFREVSAMWKQADTRGAQAPPAVQPSPVTPPRNPVTASKERALIGPTILIKGDLTGEEDLLIDGRVEGRVELRKHNITIGKNGRVKADLYGKVITVEGEVHGNLYGEEQLILRQASTVRGNILAPRVVLEDGANFKGSIDMSSKEAAQREQAPPAPGPVGSVAGSTK
jgi:cytoskeletal protein CcmA (bactofilin family)